MTRPRALDLFCGAGGAAMGLHRAGFDVTGVDIAPQPRYPFRFVRGDALRPPFDLSGFDLIWASPPCQAHSTLRKMWNAGQYEDRIPETRAILEGAGVPFVIENVVGAPLRGTIMLCGSMFGLGVRDAELRRHRWFETSFLILQPECRHGTRVIGVNGHGGQWNQQDRWRERRARTITITGRTAQQNVERNRVRQTYSANDAREAMGIDWMTMRGLSQAIPPAYSEFIGKAALAYLGAEAATATEL